MSSDRSQEVTKALVLAAGDGTRLRNHTPKPLLRVLGVPLLARALFSLERAHITDAYVVLGYEADQVRRTIEQIKGLKIRLHWLYNDQWEGPNGLSVLAGETVLEEPFILTMCDHLFDPWIVTTLRENAAGLRGVDLAVDYDIDGVTALADATRVQVASERILAIGKSLSDYDAIDTGLFLAAPELFHALREASAEGNPTLSQGVQRLASRGMARVTDIGDRMWHDIDTPEDAAEGERRLLASVRKSTDGPVARYLNRPISTALSRQLVKTPITPNQVSVATLVVSLISAGLAAVGGYVPWLLSGILFQAASILDGTDGEVAKLTFRTSVRGEWIDTVCDNIGYLAFLGGLIVGVYRSPLPDFYYFTGILGLAATFVSVVNLSIYLIVRKKSGSFLAIRYGYEEGNDVLSRVMRVAHYSGKRDLLAFLAMALAIVGLLPLGLLLFGFGATLLLLPASIKVNLESIGRGRRPVPAASPAPLWGVQGPEWMESEQHDRAS